MARIDPPTAREIFNEASVSVAALGRDEESEVIRDINEFLPDIVRTVNMKVDQAARPLDFPFSDDDIVAASPWKAGNAEKIAEEKEDQQGQVRRWILLAAAAQLVGRTVGRQRQQDGSRSPVKDRYDELKADRDDVAKTAIEAIEAVAKRTPEGAAVQTQKNYFPSSKTITLRRRW